MRTRPFAKVQTSTLVSVAVAGLTMSSSALAWKSPTQEKYMKQPLVICDQGTFYVGGAPKVTPFGAGPTPGANAQIIIGAMYVQFQRPMVSKTWPLVMVHGSGYTGSAVQGTSGGTEGWADYTVRNGVPTYVVDQPGRGRSGFDKSVIHEAEYLIDSNPTAAKELMPTLGGSTSTAWTAWFGHIVPQGSDITTGQMIRHGDAGDPLCETQPAHCMQLGRIPMEPEAPWAVDQAIASRTGFGAPDGRGTVVPDTGGHVNPAYPQNDRYLALDAYKFNVPNTEATLPGSTCPTCTPSNINSTNTWAPRALAELLEGLGGAVVATHSQAGSIGHHMARILKEHGNLNLLKGLITIEGSCSLTGAGLNADGSDFVNIPYMAFKGDYTNPSAGCAATVDTIKAAGGKADNIELDQPGFWQGSYAGPFGPDYVGPFAGVSHMMMIEDNPAPRGGKTTAIQTMDVMLKWADMNISKPAPKGCGS